MKRLFTLLAVLSVVGCGSADEPTPAHNFMAGLTGLCGQAYEGRVVSSDDVDAGFASEKLVMHVRECAGEEIRIPFHVGEDRSRTWVITRTDSGLRLKHDHRHEDGEEDAVTQYGGDSAMVTANRAEFPVDQYSIDLFTRKGLTASVTNVWAVEVSDELFAYELSRENRFFRVEFDLNTPVPTPPAPWGAAE
ncbi:MAG: hypothetical protein AAFX54_17190 [Pseudomonadota bacterium]